VTGVEDVILQTEHGKGIQLRMISDEYHLGTYHGMPELCPLYDDSFLDWLSASARERVHHGYDCNILYSGKRRRGKSTCAAQVGLAINPGYSVDSVAWDTPEFNDLLDQAPYADPAHGLFPQVTLDEAGYVMYTKNWMKEVQKNLVLKFQVLGAKRIITHFVLPHRMMLAKDVREDMIEYWVHVTEREGYRGVAELRQGVENKWEREMYWRPIAAFTFSELTGDWWSEYSRRKIAFINMATARPLTGSDGERQDKALRQRDAAIRALYMQTHLSHAKIGEALGIPRTTIDSILSPSKQRSL
jgi:hypothetical protein